MTRSSRPRLRPRLTPLEDRLTPATFTVDLLADTVAADGKTSLREAVSAANTAIGTDTIAFDPSFAGSKISLGAAGGGLFFSESVSLQGFSANPLTVTGSFDAKSANKDVFLFDTPATATVTGLKVTNTTAGGNGIVNRGTLTLSNVTVDGVAVGSGVVNSGTAALTNCVITNCVNPGGFGGGGAVNTGTLTLTDSRVTGNKATAVDLGVGGGILSAGAKLTLTNVEISNNTAAVGGGGLAVAAGIVTVTGTGKISGNTAQIGGGVGVIGSTNGATVTAPTVTFANTLIDGNTAVTAGGIAVAADSAAAGPTVVLTNVQLSNNSAELSATGNLTVSVPIGSTTPLTFTAPRGSGGGAVLGLGSLSVTGGSVNGNQATRGGGVEMLGGTLAVAGSTLSNNAATSGGGGVGVSAGAVTVTNSTVDGNRGASGAGLGVAGGTVTVANSTVTANAATGTAGGIGITAGTVTVRSSVVALNTAAAEPDTGGTFTSGGGNVVGSPGSATGFGASDQLGTSAAPLNPKLGPLANNGGPTLTRLPLAGSPAVDKGIATGAPATDQRGQPRPGGAGVDAGAVERQPGDPATPPGSGTLARTFAAGADAGGVARVRAFDQEGAEQLTLTPFGETFTGGVRAARADLTGDGVDEIIAGTGPGVSAAVKVLDGKTRAVLFDVVAFEASFTGGLYVAVGDLNDDGTPDLVITPDEGGGPRCDVYSGAGFGKIASFFGIDDPNFRGGARSAVADVNGDGTGDLLVAAGFGGGPRLAGFSGKSLAGTPTRVFGDFFVFEQTLRNGVFITAGDIDGDGKADIIAGGGPGGGPRVFALSGDGLTNGNQEVQLANFFGGDEASRGGIRVAVKDLDGDARADLLVGAGSGAGSRVTGYYGKDVSPAGTPAEAFAFDAFSGFAGGVFVG